MFTGEADHADEMQLAAFGIFIRNAVEELEETKEGFRSRQVNPTLRPPSGEPAELHGGHV